MARGRLTPILHQIHRLLGSPAAAAQSDGWLLERFAADQDEAAFTTLVQRHGPLVHDVCRRVLGQAADVDDAFQATFLVLARKAGSIRKRDSVASWLFGVALRVARKAKAQAGRRRSHERLVYDMAAPDPARLPAGNDLRPLLDEELGHLPEKFRAPLVLCYLQGMTNEQAAQELRCPAGSMSWRLVRGKEMLRRRLERRGVALSVSALAMLLDSSPAPAGVAVDLVQDTVRSAVQFAQVGTVAGPAGVLAEGVLTAMVKTRWTTAIVVALLGSVVAGGVVLAGWQMLDRPAAMLPVAAEAAPALDVHGDPLPPGAVGRLGTVRLRHHGHVWSVAYSPDGTMLASCGEGGAVFLWDRASGRELRRIPVGAVLVSNLRFSPDGKTLAVAEHAGVRLIDVATSKEVRRLKGEAWVQAIAFTPDGKHLVGADLARDRVVRRWDVATSEEVQQAARCSALEQYNFALAPDGRTVITWQHDGPVRLVDTATGNEMHTLKGHKRRVTCAAYSADGRVVATGNSGGPEAEDIRLWDVATGKETGTVPGHPIWTSAVALSPDGQTVASLGWDRVAEAGRDAVIVLHRIADRKEVGRFHPAQYRTGTGMPANRLLFSPDGKTLTVYGSGSAIRQWDIASGKQLHAAEGVEQGITRVLFTPDGRQVATLAQGESVVRLWDPATGKELRQFAHPRGVITCTFTRDGRTLATTCEDHPDYLIRLWDVATGKEQRQLTGHRNRVEFLGFTPDDRQVVAWDQYATTRLHDLAGGKPPREAVGRKGRITALAPDGRTALYQVGHERGTFLWDLESAKELDLPAEFRDARTSAGTFSPDGRSVATYNILRRLLLLYDVRTGKPYRSFPAGMTWGQALAFAPDGKILATVASDRTTIVLWDVATGQARGQFAGDQFDIYSVMFSPDGKRLTAAGKNATVLIWDVSAAQPPTAPASVERPAQEMEKLWEGLAAEREIIAMNTLEGLTTAPRQLVPFLQARLKPAGAAPDAAIVARHVAALDAEQFEVRQRAADALEAFGETAENDLRKVLEGKPSLELRQRVEALLGKIATGEGDRRRALRAIDLLEGIRTAESKSLLQTLARGRADAPVTRAAQVALARAWPSSN